VGQVFFPLDERLHLAPYQQATRRLERLACEVGLRLPYAQAATVMQEMLCVAISGRQVEHMVDKHGQRAVAARDQALAEAWDQPEPLGKPPTGPEVLYIEADGAWINSREQLRVEGKVGLVHQGPEAVGATRRRLRHATYVVTFADSDRLGQELYLEAEAQGLEHAQRVILLGDGANWIRTLQQEHFYDATYVLDWFHLQRALADALQPAQAELGTDYVAAKSMALRDLLWFGEVDLALHRLGKLRGHLQGGKARDAITDLMRFIRNHRDGIGYADLAAQGIHVGSGPIEKAADLLINRRCELRGMAWYHDTADGICNLRAIRFNHPQRWRDFWN
jgi:hypothetical protein